MTHAIRHRGPNGAGLYLDQGLALGHARLSVQDLSSAGRQPMVSGDGRYVIVFNGEIYNFKKLREQLELKGIRHKTGTDTEVLLNAYIQWGESCLDRLCGMFAFAIWDSQKRNLFLARDRIGIKPLYYVARGRRFAFASEIKALLRLPWVTPDLCLPAMGRFLQLRYNDGEKTLFEGIVKLQPAHKLLLTPDGLTASRYWRLRIPQSYERRTVDDWLEELHGLLHTSMEDHLISDVPIGVFLSGGIDSNTVMALSTELNGRAPDTFSVGFSTEKGNDELSDIRESKSHFGSRHHELILTPKIENLLDEVIWASDEPLADPALLPTYQLSKMAAREVRVVLSGEGGDELFGGYERTMLMRYGRSCLRWVPQSIRQLGVQTLSKVPRKLLNKVFKYSSKLGDKGFERLAEFVRTIDSPCSSYLLANGVFTEDELMELFAPGADGALEGLMDPVRGDNAYFRGMTEPGFVNYALRFEIETRLWADLLMKLDNAAMPFGLEGRVPFLDHRLVEFSARIPVELKIRFGKEKWILRQAAMSYLPEAIRNRKKEHFFVPIDRWLNEDLADFSREKLNKAYLERQGLFDHAYVENVYDRYKQGTLVYARQIWNLICFQTWYDIYIENNQGRLNERADDDFSPRVTYAS